jgi:hypothetical protein
MPKNAELFIPEPCAFEVVCGVCIRKSRGNLRIVTTFVRGIHKQEPRCQRCGAWELLEDTITPRRPS